MLPPEVHTAAQTRARGRKMQEKALRRPVAVQTQRPPRHHAQHRAWLQAVISRTCDSSRTKRERPLVLSRTLFDGRSISEESMAVLLLWASLWASKHVTVSFDSTCGFGLRATTDVQGGAVLARGCCEPDLEENGYDLQFGGSMLGPAALVNAACLRCANARFQLSSSGVWRLVSSRVIHSTQAVLASYETNKLCVGCTL